MCSTTPFEGKIAFHIFPFLLLGRKTEHNLHNLHDTDSTPHRIFADQPRSGCNLLEENYPETFERKCGSF